MADLVVTVTQVADTATSEGAARDQPGSWSPRFEAIDLEVCGRAATEEAMDKLVTIAERGCIVHNTLASAVALSVRRA